ncbi:grpE protein homolog, mitochondrial Roe1 [Leptinotarsa decemlineata]|uniref:grpE protein homolog, mitochondrial Roe1 n=1 Tax=Leptinotarsa decemlineata TaxID=7539 RepID=UPI003D30C307
MALISLRSFLKCGQIVNESILFNNRSLALSSTRKSSIAEETKPDPAVQDISEKDKSEVNVEIDKLNKQITELSTQNAELLDKYKRSLADGENLRNRLTKQISEAKIYGIQSFCKDLLDVADVLAKATDTVPKEELTDKNPHLKSLYEGLIMTEAQLKSVFKRHGLEQVNPLNEKFNPNFHEALFQQEVAGKESGTVVVVSKIGYKLNDRVIRPALVGVSK